VIDVGNRVQATWRARLDDQLGQYTVEPSVLLAGRLLDRPRRLAALYAACVLVQDSLAERDPHPLLYDALVELGEVLSLDRSGRWPEIYVRFELLLLAELGFGLDLGRCALTGASEGLAYVSPRSGRAVTRNAAGEWAPRLLPLPAFLTGDAPADAEALEDGLRLTGAFLQRHLFDATERSMPAARERLVRKLSRRLHMDTLDGDPA
jgi:DNA repair protein RecO (recombination protein O)